MIDQLEIEGGITGKTDTACADLKLIDKRVMTGPP